MPWNHYHYSYLNHSHPREGVWTPRGSPKYAVLRPLSLPHALQGQPRMDQSWLSYCFILCHTNHALKEQAEIWKKCLSIIYFLSQVTYICLLELLSGFDENHEFFVATSWILKLFFTFFCFWLSYTCRSSFYICVYRVLPFMKLWALL